MPLKAAGIDAYVEWYMANRGFLSVGLYYKDLRDVLFNSTTVFTDTSFDEPGFERSTYNFNTTLKHHFFKISIANPVFTIPSNAA